jgi:hypothetical protein
VFINWIKKRGERIGIKYRSSQGSTNGIGDRVEYFAGVPGKDGKVDAKRMYFGRLNEAKQNASAGASNRITPAGGLSR